MSFIKQAQVNCKDGKVIKQVEFQNLSSWLNTAKVVELHSAKELSAQNKMSSLWKSKMSSKILF